MNWGYDFTSPFAATCTRTTANVGDVISLRASGTGGTPNYTAHFGQLNGSGVLSVSTVSGLGEGIQGTATYTVVAADAGKTITFSGYITDSCAAGSKTSSTFSCAVAITTPCTTPTCNFQVV